jgi:hypothetical protein
MKIKTVYPVIIDNENLGTSEYLSNASGNAPTEDYNAGDVNVQTSYPVILDGVDVSPRDYYSNSNGAEPTMPDQAAAKQKGLFWDKLKGGWSKISNSPSAQFALEKVAEYMKNKQGGNFGAGGFTGGMPDSTPTPLPTDTTPAPMTKTTKIVLIVGGVLVVGLIILGLVSKKK